MPNPDFKVTITASDRKNANMSRMFSAICGCFINIQTARENYKFCEKKLNLFLKFLDIKLNISTYFHSLACKLNSTI